MKKNFTLMFVVFALLSFAFQIVLNGSSLNLEIEKKQFCIVELIPPFKNVNEIKIVTNTNEYQANIYTILNANNSTPMFNNEPVEKIVINANLLEEKDWEIWLSWEGTDFIKNYLENYSQIHKITFKVLEIPKISTKIVTMSKSGVKLPDVIMVSAFDFPTYYKLNILKDNSYIPFYYDTQVVYINTELVNINSLEWSIDKLENISKKLLDNNIKPIAINPISAYWLSTFLMGYGKTPLINNKHFILTDEASKRAVETILNWYTNGLFDFSFFNRDAQIAAFLSGKVGFLFQGSFLMPKILENTDKVKILPLPKPLIPFKDYKGFATTKDGDISFTNWLSIFLKNPLFTEEFSVKYIKFFDNYISNNIPFKDTFAYTAKIAYPIPFDEKYVRFHKNVMDILKLILNKSISVEDGMKKLEEIVNNE
ncbi:MAG: extracellular solute-binding protein [Thermosipho sp. (in: Bacteria)]|nr:extracellular solute-binding protein [Thermosipho sp. (in: thermotogales)]